MTLHVIIREQQKMLAIGLSVRLELAADDPMFDVHSIKKKLLRFHVAHLPVPIFTNFQLSK